MTPDKIRNLRYALGRTQESMAKIVGCSANSWARWEQGETKPLPEFIRKLEKLNDYVNGRCR